MNEESSYRQAFERERLARIEAEKLLEERTRKLYIANRCLKRNNLIIKEKQQGLIQSEKMASVGILASGVAHEINNPVGYCLSNVGVLRDYVGSLSKKVTIETKEDEYMLDDVQSLLNETEEGLNRVAEIVTDLQGFARKSDEKLKPADINSAIHTTLTVLNNKLKYHCKLQLNLADLPNVQCDLAKIHQVLLNLVLNAAQSFPDCGVIQIETSRVGGFVLISIEDDGPGIAEQDMERIFTPFFTTKEEGAGTGLGLSVCYSIIQEHHGEIAVDSTPGVGTRFVVTLPIEQREEDKMRAK